MKRYWVRLFARRENGLRDVWPDNMQGWCSGYRHDDTPVWCAIIDAEDEDGVQHTLNECWSDVEDVSISEKPPEWLPGDRFPGARKQDDA